MIRILQAILLLLPFFSHSAVNAVDIRFQEPLPDEPCESQIVFNFEGSRGSPLYIMNSDGTGLRQIKDDGVLGERGFGLSPDGQRVIFVANNDDEHLYILNTDGSGLQQLFDTRGYGYIGFEWSPDGQWVLSNAFANSDGSETDELHLIEVATSRVVRFRLPENHSVIGLDWSPDGEQIVFSAGEWKSSNSQSDIFIISVDGLIEDEQVAPINITNNDVFNWEPHWSPRGDKIAFASNRDGDFDIYTMNVDGTEVVNQTHDDNDNYGPVWSPDGERIAYRNQMDEGVRDLYIQNVGESSSRLLFPAVGGYDWSPDGNYLAVTEAGIPDYDLYLVDAHTGDVTGLIGDAIDDIRWITGFNWSPCLN